MIFILLKRITEKNPNNSGIESKRGSMQSFDALMMDSIISESSACGVTCKFRLLVVTYYVAL